MKGPQCLSELCHIIDNYTQITPGVKKNLAMLILLFVCQSAVFNLLSVMITAVHWLKHDSFHGSALIILFVSQKFGCSVDDTLKIAEDTGLSECLCFSNGNLITQRLNCPSKSQGKYDMTKLSYRVLLALFQLVMQQCNVHNW